MESSALITSEQLGIASALFSIIAFFGAIAVCKYKGLKMSLTDLIARALAASMIPAVIVILICAVDTSLLVGLGSVLQVYIAIAGLSLGFVSIEAIFKPFPIESKFRRPDVNESTE